MPGSVERVLMIAPTPFFSDRGCHVHIAEQAYALQRFGLQVMIVTYHLGRDLPGLRIRRTATVPWYRKRGPGPSWHKFYVDVLLLISTLRVARLWRPDVIHAHLHEGCLLGWVVSRLTGVPLIFDVQGSLTGELVAHDFLLARARWLLRWWRALERLINSLPETLVAQSTEMRSELETLFGVSAKNISMTYDGVNTIVFKPGDRDMNLATTLGILPNHKVVVYLGGLSPHKGADVLLDAFAIVAAQVPEAYLLLMGYPDEERYRERARQLGLARRIRVTGKVAYEDAPRYLILGDVAVAPKRSQTEANGKIYHYMACGLPTVAFDTVVNREILGELAAYVSDLEDVAALAKTIVQLLQDDKRRHALAQQSRERAVAHYSWDGVAQRLVSVYGRAKQRH